MDYTQRIQSEYTVRVLTPDLRTEYSRQYRYQVRLSIVLTHGLKGEEKTEGSDGGMRQRNGAGPIRYSD